jgi:hypothetical protein
MSEHSTDELRLRATEAQMRRALGLDGSSPAKAQTDRPISSNAHIHRRQFARDGEVPVTVIHHDDPGGTNKLESTRQALREQVAAREQVERQLEEALATIRALNTQLAHERMAKDEALNRSEEQRRQLEGELETERTARQQAEQECRAVIVERQAVEDKLRAITAALVPQQELCLEPAKSTSNVDDMSSAVSAAPEKDIPTAKKRRGRPPKVRDADPEFVEWWKPGWRDRFQ